MDKDTNRPGSASDPARGWSSFPRLASPVAGPRTEGAQSRMTAACMSGRRRKAAAGQLHHQLGGWRPRVAAGAVGSGPSVARSGPGVTGGGPRWEAPQDCHEVSPGKATHVAAAPQVGSSTASFPRQQPLPQLIRVTCFSARPRWPRVAPRYLGKAALRSPGHGAQPARPCPLRPTAGQRFQPPPGGRAPAAPPRGTPRRRRQVLTSSRAASRGHLPAPGEASGSGRQARPGGRLPG